MESRVRRPRKRESAGDHPCEEDVEYEYEVVVAADGDPPADPPPYKGQYVEIIEYEYDEEEEFPDQKGRGIELLTPSATQTDTVESHTETEHILSYSDTSLQVLSSRSELSEILASEKVHEELPTCVTPSNDSENNLIDREGRFLTAVSSPHRETDVTLEVDGVLSASGSILFGEGTLGISTSQVDVLAAIPSGEPIAESGLAVSEEVSTEIVQPQNVATSVSVSDLSGSTVKCGQPADSENKPQSSPLSLSTLLAALPMDPHSRTASAHQRSAKKSTPRRRGGISSATGTPTVAVPESFRAMLAGDSPRKATRAVLPASRNAPAFPRLPIEEIMALAEDQIRAQPRRHLDFTNARTVSDVISELNNLKIEAIQVLDYPRSARIGEAIERLRRGFRTNERENFYKERLALLKNRLADAKAAVAKRSEVWKDRKHSLERECQDERRVLEERQKEEVVRLNEVWRDPRTMRKFSKRSPHLLQTLTIEKSLALVGDLMTAEEVRKENRRAEKTEASANYEAMEDSYELARLRLLAEHEEQIKAMEQSHALRADALLSAKTEDMEKVMKRQTSLQMVIDDEDSYENFVARQCRKPADVIVPMAMAPGGGADVPLAKQSIVARDAENMRKFRQSAIASPLNLPPLKVKELKAKKKTQARRGKSRF
jgi:hypothetical protein